MTGSVVRRASVAIRTGGAISALLVLVFAGAHVRAQAQGRGGGAQPPETPQASAPIDLTGNWVAVVTEDWRWRMVTPPKGDFDSLPLNDEGQKVLNTWSPAMDGQCEAYGVGGLLRMPTRLRISWQDPQTLKIETDNGSQTRLLHFGDAMSMKKPTARSLQGFTTAEWERPTPRGRGGNAAPTIGGSLVAHTTMVSPGWLRRNGVPYSADAEIMETFDRFTVPNGDEWFSVETVLHDPKYFNQDVVISSHFKKEADGSKWSPSTCRRSS
jgi:hypothetical protein